MCELLLCLIWFKIREERPEWFNRFRDLMVYKNTIYQK